VGVLAGFGHDGFITSQKIDIISVKQVGAKKEPEQRGPGNEGGEEALDGAIAAAVSGPARNALHGDTPSHSQQGVRDTVELAYGGHGHLRKQAQQE
jgi:hypothetical protein